MAANGARHFQEHWTKLSNRRNEILYAAEQGGPSWDGSVDGYVRRRRQVILHNLVIYLMIEPYPEKQLFVQQALSAFLHLLGLIPQEPREDAVDLS